MLRFFLVNALPGPGEVTPAQHGLPFLNEVPEFGQSTPEALRQPIEDKVVIISHGQGSATFPASFTLIGAVNPCPRGLPRGPQESLHLQE